ncbi:MAG: metallophosphoesterase [Phycisphaerae bacterium]
MNDILHVTKHHPRPRRAFLKRMLWKAAGSCALGGLWTGRPEDHYIRQESLGMTLPNLGSDLRGATLVQLSDLHCSPIVLERYLNHCVDIVNDMEPDFVALTGDFITGPVSYARRIARVLRRLEPSVATLACLGNHDYGILHPGGLGASRHLDLRLSALLAEADVFVMRNESRTFEIGDSAIQFVGVEDIWTNLYDPREAFELIDPNLPTVALCHNPDGATDMARRGAHWTLSGHTHGRDCNEDKWTGMVIPSDARHFTAGYYDLGDDAHLYVNRGLSYGRRTNINARPEITRFTMREK